jgi:hypothetical protein
MKRFLTLQRTNHGVGGWKERTADNCITLFFDI